MKPLYFGMLFSGALLAFALGSGVPQTDLTVQAASHAESQTKRVLGQDLVPAGTLYSPGVSVGHTVYVAGLQGTDPRTHKLPQAFDQEVRNALNNVGEVLKDGGMGYDDVVSVQIFLVDISQFQAVNEIYKEYFKAPLPARCTVQVSKLSLGSRIEISAVAQRQIPDHGR